MSTKSKFDTYDNEVPVVVVPSSVKTYNERDYLGGQYPNQALSSYGFRCFLYLGESSDYDYFDLTDVVSAADWDEDLDSAAMSLKLTLWDPVVAGSRDLNAISKGDTVSFYVRDIENGKMKPVSTFVVWEITRGSTSSPTIEVTCYDKMIYLLKSQDNFLFNKSTSKSGKGWTATDITNHICQKYGIPKGFVAKAKHKIPYFRADQDTPYDVLLKAWTEERKETDVRYIIRMEHGKLVVRAKQEQKQFWQVASNENLIDISYTNSLEGIASAVRAISMKNEGSSSTSTSGAVDNGSGSDLEGAPAGEGWKVSVATHFDVAAESGLACSGYTRSSSLKGFAELSNNHADPGGWDWRALGGLSCGQKIEVQYKGKRIVIPKVDVGRGGPGIGSTPRGIDLTRAAWNELIGADKQSMGKVEVYWRKVGLADGDVESTGSEGPAEKMSADVLAVHQPMVDTYGYIQKLLTLDAGVKTSTAKKLAENALKESSRENYDASLTTYFLPFLRAGDPIHVIDEGTGLNGRYYCSDVSHSLSPSGSRTNIGLNWLDVVPSLEIESKERAPRPVNTPPPTGGGYAPFGNVGGYAPGSSGCGVAVIEAGKRMIGKVPYSWGGGGMNGPTEGFGRGKGKVGFDCSSFAMYCWWQGAGVKINRTTDTQAAMITSGFAESIPLGQEQVGDLVLFPPSSLSPGTRYGHVALWVDKGKVLECGGRAGGVGFSNRNDWVTVVRVSKHCRDGHRGNTGSSERDATPLNSRFMAGEFNADVHVPGSDYVAFLNQSDFKSGDKVLLYRDGSMNLNCVCIAVDIEELKSGALGRKITAGGGVLGSVVNWFKASLRKPNISSNSKLVVQKPLWPYFLKSSEKSLRNSRGAYNLPMQVINLSKIQNAPGVGSLSAKQVNDLLSGRYGTN